jgi:transposase
MSLPAQKPVITPIPVQLSEHEFDAFILPHLSMPKRGPKCKLSYHRVLNLILWLLYTGMQWKCLPIPTDAQGKPALHYTNIYRAFAQWVDDGSLEWAFIAITDNHGYVLAPLPVAPVNETDMALLPQSLHALKKVAKQVGLDLRGAYFNLDGGFDSKDNRKRIFNAGLIPNIPENPRNRKRAKRGRKRLFNAAIHALRLCVERTFAWEDKFKRLLLRFERLQQRHYGMKLMAYTLINLRAFCGA